MAFHQQQQQSQLLSSPQHVSDSEPERETARLQRSRARSPLSLDDSPSPVQQPQAGPSGLASASALSLTGRDLPGARDQDDHSFENPSVSNSFATSQSVTPITPPRPHQNQYQQQQQQQTRDSPATLSSDQSTSEASPGTSFGQHLKAKFAFNNNKNNGSRAHTQPTQRPLHTATNFFKSRSVPLASTADPQASTSAPETRTYSKKQLRGKNAVDPAVSNIIPLGLMGLLSDCPVCKAAWTAKKSGAVKLNHISSCAHQQGYDLETVRVLIEQRLKSMQDAEEQDKARQELDRSLFDQVVGGAAQGVLRGGKKAKVQVVGRDAEAVAATQGGTVHEHVSSTQVSNEISRASKQPKSNSEKKIRSAVKLLESTKTPAEATSARSTSASSNSKTKKAPGRLQSYTQTKDRLADKAQTMMEDITAASASNTAPSLSVQNVSNSNLSRGVKSSGAQLSLQNLQQDSERRSNPAPARPVVSQRRVIEIDIDSDQDLNEAGEKAEEVELPSTQPLQPSSLALPQDVSTDTSASEIKAGMWAFASSRQEDEVQDSAFDAILPSPPFPSTASVSPLASPSRMAPPKSQMLSSAPNTPLSSSSTARSFSATAQVSPEGTKSPEPPAPDYASWSVDQLQAEAQRYGYKPPGTKVACINLLTRIWHMLNRKGTAAEPAPATPAPKKSATASLSSRTSKAKTAADTPTQDEIDGKQKKTPAKRRSQVKKPRVSAASMADAGEDLGTEEADDVDVGFEESMRRLIRRDDELWPKLLRYQPVSFETFDRMATDNNLKHTAIGLRRFLDSQSIAFFMEGPHKDRTRGGQKYAPPKKKTAATSKKKNTTS